MKDQGSRPAALLGFDPPPHLWRLVEVLHVTETNGRRSSLVERSCGPVDQHGSTWSNLFQLHDLYRIIIVIVVLEVCFAPAPLRLKCESEQHARGI